MNDDEEHPLLVAVATTIADGMPVDWSSLMAEHPELSEELLSLKVLQGIETTSQDSTGPGAKR